VPPVSAPARKLARHFSAGHVNSHYTGARIPSDAPEQCGGPGASTPKKLQKQRLALFVRLAWFLQ
jgi:hypothetical protein